MTVVVRKVVDKSEATLFARVATEDAVAALDKTARIIIKPNFCYPEPPCTGVSTHYEVLAGVLEALRDFTDVYVVESSPTSHDFSSNVAGWGGAYLFKQYPNATLVDLTHAPSSEVTIQGQRRSYRLQFADLLLERDFLINLPVPKTHLLAGMTMGIKNLFGLLKEKNKSQFHPVIHDIAFGLCQFFSPDLTIVDGLEGMEGEGPIFGTPAGARFVAASHDVVAMDAVGCDIIGIEARTVPYLKALMLHHFGTTDTQQFHVMGDHLRLSFKQVEPLSCQVARILLTESDVSLEKLQHLVSAPKQTIRNLPVFSQKLVDNGAVEKHGEHFVLPFERIDTFLDLFPETESVFASVLGQAPQQIASSERANDDKLLSTH